MDLKDILKANGMTDEQIASVLQSMKENTLHVVEGDNPEETLKALQEENKRLKAAEGSSKEEKRRMTVVLELVKAGATDPEYLLYQMEKKGLLSKVTEEADGKLAGVTEVVEELQTGFQNFFRSDTKETKDQENPAADNVTDKAAAPAQPPAEKQVVEKKLDVGETSTEPETLEEAIMQTYAAAEAENE